MARYNITSGQTRGNLGGLQYQMRGGVCIVRSKPAVPGGKASAAVPEESREPLPFLEADLSGSLEVYQSGLLFQDIRTRLVPEPRLIPTEYHGCVFRLSLSGAVGGEFAGGVFESSLRQEADLSSGPVLAATGEAIGTAVLYSPEEGRELSSPFPVLARYEVLGVEGEAPFSVTAYFEDAGVGDAEGLLCISTGAYAGLSFWPGTIECRPERPVWGSRSFAYEGLEAAEPVRDHVRVYLENDGGLLSTGRNGHCAFTRESSDDQWPVVADKIPLFIEYE